MYQKPVLSFAQVQISMEAMIERAKQLALPIAIAIVDDAVNLKAYVAMDNERPFVRRHAVRKAYTVAIFVMDSGAHAEQPK